MCGASRTIRLVLPGISSFLVIIFEGIRDLSIKNLKGQKKFTIKTNAIARTLKKIKSASRPENPATLLF
jgi:hypothetical protein